MRMLRLWNPRQGGLALLGRLEHLRTTLDGLGDQLRDAVAEAVGRAAAGLVGDAVRAALDGPTEPAPPPLPDWHEPDDTDWQEPADWATADEAYGASPAEAACGPAVPAAARLPAALTVGARAAAWWLRRRTGGRGSAPSAACIGLLAACATYAAGPLAATCLGLAGSMAQAAGLGRARGGD